MKIDEALLMSDNLKAKRLDEGIGQGIAKAAGKALYNGASKVLGKDVADAFVQGKNGTAQTAPAQPAQPQAAPFQPTQAQPEQATATPQQSNANAAPQAPQGGILSGIANKIAGAFKPDGGLNQFLSKDQKIASVNKDLTTSLTQVVNGVTEILEKAKTQPAQTTEQPATQQPAQGQPAPAEQPANGEKKQEAMDFIALLNHTDHLREAVDTAKVVEQVSTILKKNIAPLLKKVKANQALSADETKYLNGALAQIANIKMFSGLKQSIGTVTSQLKTYDATVAAKEKEAESKGLTNDKTAEGTPAQDAPATDASTAPADGTQADAKPQTGDLTTVVTQTLNQIDSSVKTLDSIQLTKEQADKIKELYLSLRKKYLTVYPKETAQ